MSNDVKIPTTGYVEHDGVLAWGPAAIKEFKTVTIDRPRRVMRFLIDGDFPDPNASNIRFPYPFMTGPSRFSVRSACAMCKANRARRQ